MSEDKFDPLGLQGVFIEPKAPERCDNCSFMRDNKCKRYPPVMVVGYGTSAPLVQNKDWCGEYKRV
jgi:hypothetical protein